MRSEWRLPGNSVAAARRRALPLLCVFAIHLLLYGWLRNSGGWQIRREAQPTPPLVTLRLLPWPEPAREQLSPEVGRVTRPGGAFDPIRLPTPPRDARGPTPPSTSTSTSTPAIEPTQARDSVNPPASPASQPPPLNLALPPEYSRRAGTRNPAVDDPRANTARTTPEQRMATRFDTRVIEEDLGNGRRRFRRGDDCVIVTQSRIGQVMPFNEAAARSPSLVSACP